MAPPKPSGKAKKEVQLVALIAQIQKLTMLLPFLLRQCLLLLHIWINTVQREPIREQEARSYKFSTSISFLSPFELIHAVIFLLGNAISLTGVSLLVCLSL